MLGVFEGGGGILNSEGMDCPRILNSGGAAAGGILNSECLGTHSLTHSLTYTHTHTRVLIAIPAAGAGGLDIILCIFRGFLYIYAYLEDLPIFCQYLGICLYLGDLCIFMHI